MPQGDYFVFRQVVHRDAVVPVKRQLVRERDRARSKCEDLVQVLQEQVVDDLPLEHGLIGGRPGFDQAIEQTFWIDAESVHRLLKSAPGQVRESRSGLDAEPPSAIHAAEAPRRLVGPIPLITVTVFTRCAGREKAARAYGIPPEIPIRLKLSELERLGDVFRVRHRFQSTLASNEFGAAHAGTVGAMTRSPALPASWEMYDA